MKNSERSIKLAFEKLSGIILEADKVFAIQKDAFLFRLKANKHEVDLYCCECGQPLNVSISRYDNLYFKHQPNADECILKEGKLTPEDEEKLNKILFAKESPRHHELKNKIGERLMKVEGVDVTSIAIDSRFIIRGKMKRRPDVYCKYLDKELVFEIQLSDLPLSYILSRYEFYKMHGIYLIWILDNFNVYNQGQLERDIKYLAKYENFFKLDEKTEDLKLECEYKFPYLTDDNKVFNKWVNKSVSLNQISFDSVLYQIFYYNFGDNKSKLEEIRERKKEELEQLEEIKIDYVRLRNANYKAIEIITLLKNLHDKKIPNFNSVILLLNKLDRFEINILNSELDFLNPEKFNGSILNMWIKNATQDDMPFFRFILNCNEIHYDVNSNGQDGKTPLQEIYLNTKITKVTLVKNLFKRGYRLTDEDTEFFDELIINNAQLKEDLVLYDCCNKLPNNDLVDLVFLHDQIVYIFESALREEIIGFNYKSDVWIQFANNAIQHHSKYWEYIEKVFKYSGLWEKLIQLDKKGTFHRKVNEWHVANDHRSNEVDEDFHQLFTICYPELSY